MKNIKIIQAGAGTGKTTKLSDVVYEYIKEGKARPEAILLTTFTRRASSELISRVRMKLINEGLRNEAYRIQQSKIGTINSVCGQILQEFAMNAGMSITQNIIAEDEEQHLFNETLSPIVNTEEIMTLKNLEELLYQVDPRSKETQWNKRVLDIIKSARYNKIGHEELLTWSSKRIDDLYSEFPKPKYGLAKLMTEVKNARDDIEKLINSGKDDKKNTANGFKFLEEIISKKNNNGSLSWQDINKLSGLEIGKRSGANDLLDPVREISQEHYLWPEMKKMLYDYTNMLYEIASRSLKEYQERKKEMGLIDFIDQEVHCHKLLEDEKVCQVLSEQLDLVLVDEVQDISPIELSFFLKLAELSKQSIWVGDPKQAIYGFRGCDPELIIEAIKTLSSGSADRLSTSYRSRPELVEFVNSCFPEAFHQQGINKTTVPLDPNRGNELSQTPLESWVLGTKLKEDEQISLLTGNVLDVLNNKNYMVSDRNTAKLRPIEPRDIAILSVTNETCDKIAESLKEWGIPVERTTPGLLSETEITLVLSGINLLLNNNDTMSAAIISYFDEVVHNSKKDTEWLEKRIKEKIAQDEMDKDNSDRYGAWVSNDIIKYIKEYPTNINSLTPIEAINLSIDLTKTWRFIRHSDDPAGRTANIEKFLSLAMEHESTESQKGNAVTIASFLQYLDEIAENENDEKAVSGINAVKVSTWHASKGLEWNMVILFSLQKTHWSPIFNIRGISTGKFDINNPLKNQGIHFIPFPYHSSSGKDFREEVSKTKLSIEMEENSMNEWLRLLYVVFTRARDYLVFAAGEECLDSLNINGTALCHVPQDPKNTPEGWEVKIINENTDPPYQQTKPGWFPYVETPTTRPSAGISPSSLTLTKELSKFVSTEEPKKFGERIKITSSSNADELMESVGNAVHQYLAVDTSRLDEKEKIEIAKRITTSLEVDENIDPGEIVQCSSNFDSWVEEHIKYSNKHCEWPVKMNTEGFEISGFADLVLEMEDSFYLLDYKSYPGKTSQYGEKAASFAPQLACYSQIIARALNKKCAGMYIVFAVGGHVVEVKIDKPEELLEKAIQMNGI